MGEVKRAYTRCPVCDHVFRAPAVRSYVTIGRESDLCPKFPGRISDGTRLIQNAITMCPNCSFAATEDFMDLDLLFDERIEVGERLGEDGLLRVMRASSPPWLPFHAAEVSGKGRGLTSRELGDLCLRASWVCRRENERPFESTFQLRTIRHFIRALDREELRGRELSVTTYLVGELNRRLGNHREALNWYVNAERTIREADGEAGLAWLDRLISQQSKLAKEQAA
jgi:uncharacterized protein (DUF2225 family)